jgi:hypothetical protein
MKFEDAFKEMRNGKKVRNVQWHPNRYWMMATKETHPFKPLGIIDSFNEYRKTPFISSISVPGIAESDWEIYEEKK